MLLKDVTLKVEKQILENHRAQITVEVDPDQIEDSKQRAARLLANRVKIPGFRPGKAPYHIIERTLGLETILQQAYEIVAEDVYPKVLDETGLKPYAPAEFKPPEDNAPTTFIFTFPMDAKVDLGEYRSIRIPYELPLTNHDDVVKTINDLRERNAVIEPVDRPAQVEDEITIKLSGKRTNPENDEDSTLVNERSQTILIKVDEDTNEWPFPAFSKQLIALSAGDEKTITYKFPDDSSYTSLRGKEVEYHIIVEQVKSRKLPEANDEFAKSIGDFETLQALEDTILEGLKSQARMNYDTEYNEKILAKVIEGAHIEYPPEMVEDQITSSINRLKSQIAEQGQEFDTYLKMRGMDIQSLREQTRPQAVSTITRSVVMYELAQAEAITVEREEMENEAMSTMNDLMRYVPPDQFKRMSKDRNFISQLSRNASVDVLSRKTYDRLKAIAKGEAEKIDGAPNEGETNQETLISETPSEITPEPTQKSITSVLPETDVVMKNEVKSPIEASSDDIPQEEG